MQEELLKRFTARGIAHFRTRAVPLTDIMDASPRPNLKKNVWEVRESLNPESRGHLTHEFQDLNSAWAFISTGVLRELVEEIEHYPDV